MEVERTGRIGEPAVAEGRHRGMQHHAGPAHDPDRRDRIGGRTHHAVVSTGTRPWVSTRVSCHSARAASTRCIDPGPGHPPGSVPRSASVRRHS